MQIFNHPKRALMFMMGALVLIGFGIANLYYNYQNNSVDPRIKEARELYSQYDQFTQSNNFKAIFQLLDSIESIYSHIAYYSQSFEVGVLKNNRAATYLSMAIYFDNNSLSLDGITTLSKDTLLTLSENEVMKSIEIYERWLTFYSNLDQNAISAEVGKSFLDGLGNYAEKDKGRFSTKRVKEIKEAQFETPRRLSVAYTNLGIIMRHREKYQEAIHCYEKAIELWDRNLAAENNLNTLLGRPLKKRNVLQKIFP
ncbi:MAG: tetratricopeptide repeat protein, partial [Prolixibacteraceae bacterium]|nr:tetratricopeptide repeat protein [Prolixibacteraceae bacterium]